MLVRNVIENVWEETCFFMLKKDLLYPKGVNADFYFHQRVWMNRPYPPEWKKALTVLYASFVVTACWINVRCLIYMILTTYCLTWFETYQDNSPLDNSPLDNSHTENSPPGQLPTRTIPHQDNSPPGHFLTRTTPHKDNPHQVNSHWDNS